MFLPDKLIDAGEIKLYTVGTLASAISAIIASRDRRVLLIHCDNL